MGPILDQVLDGSVIAIITAVGTWFGLSKHMEKKYQTLIDAKVMEAAQKVVDERLDKKLDKLKKKTMFNNLICLRLAKEHPNISAEELEGLRRSCELNDIPE